MDECKQKHAQVRRNVTIIWPQSSLSCWWMYSIYCALHMYLHSSVVKMELGYTVWCCSFLGLKLFPHTGKSPRQGTDLRLLHDLMKQEISLAASTSTWPEIKLVLNRAILSGMHAVQAAVKRGAANAMCGLLSLSTDTHTNSQSILFIVSNLHEDLWELFQSKANNILCFLQPSSIFCPVRGVSCFPSIYICTI